MIIFYWQCQLLKTLSWSTVWGDEYWQWQQRNQQQQLFTFGQVPSLHPMLLFRQWEQEQVNDAIYNCTIDCCISWSSFQSKSCCHVSCCQSPSCCCCQSWSPSCHQCQSPFCCHCWSCFGHNNSSCHLQSGQVCAPLKGQQQWERAVMVQQTKEQERGLHGQSLLLKIWWNRWLLKPAHEWYNSHLQVLQYKWHQYKHLQLLQKGEFFNEFGRWSHKVQIVCKFSCRGRIEAVHEWHHIIKSHNAARNCVEDGLQRDRS